MIELEHIKTVGEHLNAAIRSFMATEGTLTPIRIEPHDIIVERECACGGNRAVERRCVDNIIKRICIDCGNEVGRETSGEIGES